ncbi:MAG: DUF523 domain-containing protein [Gemmiger sp.]
MTILVSACLLGVPCKYSGGDNACLALLEAARRGRHTLIPVCPEVYGGLPTPRPPAERRGSAVVTESGDDVTAQYQRGAQIALHLARLTGCKAAILKKNSPSCGHGAIYDGTFRHVQVQGSGVTAALLAQNGLAVYNEDNCATLLSP